jgi:hypothetical protein
MIRVIHHAQDAPRVLQGIGDVIAPGGTFVLEFANKRNIKALVRWILQKQKQSPFQLEPHEFVELNFNFHPRWMQLRLRDAGFAIEAQRTVSHFRLPLLKRLIGASLLVKLDKLAQPTGRWWQLTPSVFTKSQASKAKPAAAEGDFFRCPICRSAEMVERPSLLICQGCQRKWPIHNGLYDFKDPL